MAKKIRVGVAGYGTIGQRLADGVALQDDMELVGVADLAPTLAIRALKEKGMQITDPDTAAFQAAVKPVYDKYGPKFGTLLDDINKAKK